MRPPRHRVDYSAPPQHRPSFPAPSHRERHPYRQAMTSPSLTTAAAFIRAFSTTSTPGSPPVSSRPQEPQLELDTELAQNLAPLGEREARMTGAVLMTRSWVGAKRLVLFRRPESRTASCDHEKVKEAPAHDLVLRKHSGNQILSLAQQTRRNRGHAPMLKVTSSA